MSLKRILSFDLGRVDVNRILSFDVNRILFYDVNRIPNWRVPPLLLKALTGWFLAALAIDLMGMPRNGLAVFLAAASAGMFMLPDLVRRMRAPR